MSIFFFNLGGWGGDECACSLHVLLQPVHISRGMEETQDGAYSSLPSPTHFKHVNWGWVGEKDECVCCMCCYILCIFWGVRAWGQTSLSAVT